MRLAIEIPSHTGWHPDFLQLCRRANLRTLTEDLEQEGLETLYSKAKFLGISAENLRDMLRGAHIDCNTSRTVEDASNRRRGWLDDDHRLDPG